MQLANPAFWSCAISAISGRDWLSVSPSIHFFVHGQMLFLEIGKRRGRKEGKEGRTDDSDAEQGEREREAEAGGVGNGFMMPLESIRR